MINSNYILKIKLKQLQKQNKKVNLLGLDLGTYFVGISICDHNLKHAKAYGHYQSQTRLIEDPNFKTHIHQIIKKQNITALCVGNPVEEQELQLKFDLIIKNLQLSIPYTKVDETRTTSSSIQIIESLGLKNKKSYQDVISSQLILQKFIDYYNY